MSSEFTYTTRIQAANLRSAISMIPYRIHERWTPDSCLRCVNVSVAMLPQSIWGWFWKKDPLWKVESTFKEIGEQKA